MLRGSSRKSPSDDGDLLVGADWKQHVLRAAVLVPAGPGVDPCLLPQRALLGHDGWHGLGPDSPPGLTLTLPARSGIVWNVCRMLWHCVVPGGLCALHDAADGFTGPEAGVWARQDAVMPTESDCIGHGDLNPGNLLFDGDQVVGIIDFDVAGPTTRAFDLALLAHHLVPLHRTDDLAAFGWDHEPDRARRLDILAAAYGREISPAQLVDYAVLRLLSMGAHMQQINVGNPAFAGHGRRDEPAGYRSAAAFVLAHRGRVLR
jgi:hypothetical protein